MDNQKGLDIFPRYLSKNIEKLCYPSKNFDDFKSEGTCSVFLQHMDHRTFKIYCYLLSWTEQYTAHMQNVGRESQAIKAYQPQKINWNKVAGKLVKPTSQELRKNSDPRIGFKNGNRYLVKAYFTFGQRTVEKGTVHIVQTLNVPLVFYLMERGMYTDARLKRVNGLLPFNSMHLYDRRVLCPNGCYRIPPETTYILASCQKNFFSVDIFPEDAQIPASLGRVMDPVAHKVTKIPDIYEKPVATPYIEDVVEEKKSRALEDLFATIRPSYPSTSIGKRPSSFPDVDELEPSFKRPFIQQQEFTFERSAYPEQEFIFKRPFLSEEYFIHAEQQESFIQPTAEQQESFIQPTAEQQESFIQPTAEQQESFIQPNAEQQESFIQPTVEQESFIKPTVEQESFVPEQQEFVFKRPADPEQQEFVFKRPADPEQQESFIQSPQSFIQPEQQFFNQSPQSFIDLLDDFIPEPQEIYSRPVVVANPDCIQYYQKLLKKTEYPSPIGDFKKQSTNGTDEPLDLSLNGISDLNTELEKYQNILLDLYSIVE